MSIADSYNRWAGIYDSNINPTRDMDALATSTILSRYSYSDVLEIGCGTGKNTEFLLEKAEAVIGLDISDEMLAIAGNKINSPKVNFIQSDLRERWPVKDSFADLAICNLVLEHLEDLPFIFLQTNLKLKPGGLFFISELHPLKAHAGSRAKFEIENHIETMTFYLHEIPDYLAAASHNGFRLLELDEWFDEKEPEAPPRLVTFLFEKV